MNEKQKDFLTWGLIILAFIVVFRFIKKFTSGQTIFGGGTGGGLGAGVFDLPTDTLQAELDKWKKYGYPPTITESQALSYADLIYNENMSLNTNEESIIDVFRKLRRQPDLILLKLKFGTRRPQFGTAYMGLSAFLRADLSNNEIEEINTILRKKAIPEI
jgi:hypothetical protein